MSIQINGLQPSTIQFVIMSLRLSLIYPCCLDYVWITFDNNGQLWLSFNDSPEK
jgi:hypothetical protein